MIYHKIHPQNGDPLLMRSGIFHSPISGGEAKFHRLIRGNRVQVAELKDTPPGKFPVTLINKNQFFRDVIISPCFR